MTTTTRTNAVPPKTATTPAAKLLRQIIFPSPLQAKKSVQEHAVPRTKCVSVSRERQVYELPVLTLRKLPCRSVVQGRARKNWPFCDAGRRRRLRLGLKPTCGFGVPTCTPAKYLRGRF